MARDSSLGRGVGTACAFDALECVPLGRESWAGPQVCPALVLTVFAGLLWGRSVLETKGLSWAVVSHAAIDLAFFLVQFVPAE